jgi:hypothetical protein
MSLRFRRRVKLVSGVHVNLGLHGAGLSVGPHGLHVGLNRRGMYTSAGIPRTGLYAVHHYRSGEHHEVRGGCGALVVWLLIAVALVMLLDFLLGLLTHS